MTEVDAAQNIDLFKMPGDPARSSVSVDAWTKTGLGFGALGPGVMYALTKTSGLVLEAKMLLLFPTFGPAISAQLAYLFGM
jgi:hypothetical protein